MEETPKTLLITIANRQLSLPPGKCNYAIEGEFSKTNNSSDQQLTERRALSALNMFGESSSKSQPRAHSFGEPEPPAHRAVGTWKTILSSVKGIKNILK